MKSETEDRIVVGIVIAFVTAFLAVIAMAIATWYQNYHRCVDNGGHFEDRNCHVVRGSVTTCSWYDSNNNCMMWTTQKTTSTQCDSVCVGANLEAQ